MSGHRWQKGAPSPNPAGRPKSAYKENFDQLLAKKRMYDEGLQIVSEGWADVICGMLEAAKSGNVQAATFLRDYLLGKPKETISHDISEDVKDGFKIVISKEEACL